MKDKSKAKKRILMLNYEFPPLGGGAGNATYYLLKEFAKYPNLEIDLITSSTDKEKIEKFSNNITIYFLDIGKKGSLHNQSLKDLLKYSNKAKKLAKKLNKEKNYNFCHAFFGIPCGYIAMKLKIPYIVSLRGSDVPGHNPKYSTLDKLFFKRLSRKVWNKASFVIPNSNDLKIEAQNTLSDKDFLVIPNGVDTSFYTNNKKKDSTNFMVFYAGRLSVVKGLNNLLIAFQKLNKEDSELIIAGDGKDKESLKELANTLKINNKVKFLGILNKKELVKQYNNSEVFVLPSINEGMSNTLLEAMSCGLPVIITQTGGAKELIKNNGLVVKPNDINGLYDSLKKLYENKDLMLKMGLESRKIVEKMSWDNVAKKYLEVYNNV